jgi:subtilase family serine protease
VSLESVESSLQWGSGGGLSTRFKQPGWQTGTGVNNRDSNGFRQIPDVAAVAFHLPIYNQGQLCIAIYFSGD